MNYINDALAVFDDEICGLIEVKNKVGICFSQTIESLVGLKGRVVVCGMGKSGHIGKKIFATFVSTGTPSMFMHPAEAFHGDLGMVLPEDIFLAISNSGETEEILKLIPFLKDNKNILISMTGNPHSTLAKASNFHLDVGVEKEACPLQLAPTASTTAALAMGDALAVCLMKARDFQPENFARFHPGGSLGRKLLGRVQDYMKPAMTIQDNEDFKAVLSKMAESTGGIICVLAQNKLAGVITDGDIRRKLSNFDVLDVVKLSAAEIMSKNPRVISNDTRCVDADNLMTQYGVNSLLVTDGSSSFYIYQNLNRG
ncbi:MAG: KpsF/GutQ family sugar-phosphate isomerase [Paraglaciecola sp.]|nr:KpsF/GutQ family sugar-phosphate isomerase [Paraglaciecola sp.]